MPVDLAFETTIDNETRKKRVEITDVETGTVIFKGPPRADGQLALYAALHMAVNHLLAARAILEQLT